MIKYFTMRKVKAGAHDNVRQFKKKAIDCHVGLHRKIFSAYGAINNAGQLGRLPDVFDLRSYSHEVRSSVDSS
jgi:hypothetical protein